MWEKKKIIEMPDIGSYVSPFRNCCSMVAGVYKKGLSDEERERFKKLLGKGTFRTSASGCSVLEGVNSLVCCFPFRRAMGEDAPFPGGGACMVSFSSLPTGQDQFPLTQMEKLNGSWAMAAVDDQRGVSLGRDIAGAQTMYYARFDGALYFASSLTLFRNFSLAIDLDAVSEFLHFLYIPAPWTIYKDVKAVLPAQVVIFDGERITETSIPRNDFRGKGFDNLTLENEEQIICTYESLLKESVKRCTSRGGKTGLFLSGGKDSSSIAIAARHSGLNSLEAICIGFDNPEIDESGDAEIVARHLGYPFRAFKFPMDLYMKYFPEFINAYGQPIGDCAALPAYVGMKETEGLFDAWLDGTGNDRYLGFTTTWQEDLAWRIHRRIPGLHHLPWKVIPKGYSYSMDFLARTLSRPRQEQFVSWHGWTEEEIKRIAGNTLNDKELCLYRLYQNASSPIVHKTWTLGNIWEPETAYRKVVQAANFLGQVVRYPFLDKQLVDFSERLPTSLKFNGPINKIIVRRLLERYMPEKIVKKKKGTFNFPKGLLLSCRNFELLDSFLSSSCIKKHGFVNDSIAQSYIQRYKDGDQSLEDRIWSLLLLHTWVELGREQG